VCWIIIDNKYQGCFVAFWINHIVAPFFHSTPHLS
jgi:hypothetical protein